MDGSLPLAPVGDRVSVVEGSEQRGEPGLELPLPDPLAPPHRLPQPPAAHPHAGYVPIDNTFILIIM